MLSGPSHQPTAPDPSAWGARAPGPVPPPWSPPPEQPGGETVTPLSPEPWDVHAEPQIWQPPKPSTRSPVPYVLGGAGITLLAAVAFFIIFWPASDSGDTPPGNVPAQQQSAAPGTQTASSADAAPGVDQQAGQVDALLTEMVGTRSELGSVTSGGCQSTDLERIRSQRQEQLAKARALQVDALENGTEMRDALVRALEASVESNQRYLDVAPGCPSEADVQSVNARATEAKRDFIEYWRPNAEKTGLAVRDPGQI